MLPIDDFYKSANVNLLIIGNRHYEKVSEIMSRATVPDTYIYSYESFDAVQVSGIKTGGDCCINMVRADSDDITEKSIAKLKTLEGQGVTMLFTTGEKVSGELKKGIVEVSHLFEIASENAEDYFASIAVVIAKSLSTKSLIRIDGVDIKKVLKNHHNSAIFSLRDFGPDRMKKMAEVLLENPTFKAHATEEDTNSLVILGGDISLLESTDFMNQAFEKSEGNIIFSVYSDEPRDEARVLIIMSYND